MTDSKSQNSSLTLRFATEEDAKTVYDMIRELAQYEKLLGGFEATETLLKESLFRKGAAETIIAEYEGTPVGYAIFFHNFSSFTATIGIYIEDIYVKPEMRGKGLGEAIFTFIAKLALKRGCNRVDWACLNWNAPSIAFYEKMGAKQLSEWTAFRLSGEALKRTAGLP